MGVLDFLFEGSPPPSTTTYGTTVENMPQWLSDYTQALIARANMVAGEGYQAYQGPRVAGFTDDQTNAFDVIRNNIGNWNDEFGASKTATSGALTQATPYFDKAMTNFDQAAGATPDQIGRYMDPYVGNVIDRAKLETNRNWEENIMPGIEGRFITSGQSGSSGHQNLLQKAGRDVTEGLHSQSLAALSDAYKTAGSQYQTDASRVAGLGQSIGQLGEMRGQLGLQTGAQLSGLAQLQQQMAGRDATALQAVGDTRQQQNQRNLDVAYQDFQNQRDYPRENVDWMSSIIRGMPYDRTTQTSGTGPANVYQPSPISQLISLYGLYKDVTDKARGGVVRKAQGGVVTPSMRRGDVVHIPGPIPGHARYADGGKVRALREIADGRRIVENLAEDWLPRSRGTNLAKGGKVKGVTELGRAIQRLTQRNVEDMARESKRQPAKYNDDHTVAARQLAKKYGKTPEEIWSMMEKSTEGFARGGLAALEY